MKYSTLLISLLFVISVVSCKKIQGCKDPEAINYDEKANIDDGSCIYNYAGDISFWFNEYRSNELVGAGVTLLTVYFDDVAAGTIDPVVWSIGPECNGETTFTTTLDLGEHQSENMNYVIRDQSGNTRFSGNINVFADECRSRQL